MVPIIRLGYKVTEGTVPSPLHAYVTGQNYMYIQIGVFKPRLILNILCLPAIIE